MNPSYIDENGLPFVRVFYPLRTAVSTLAWSHNGVFLAGALTPPLQQNESGVRIFDSTVADYRSKFKCEGSQYVLFNPSDTLICTEVDDVIYVKEFASSKQKKQVYVPKGPYRILLFSPDGESLLIYTEVNVSVLVFIHFLIILTLLTTI